MSTPTPSRSRTCRWVGGGWGCVYVGGWRKLVKYNPDDHMGLNTHTHLHTCTHTLIHTNTSKQVALAMMKAGKPVNVGDHIEYVICEKEGAKSAAERAFHPDDVERSEGELKVRALSGCVLQAAGLGDAFFAQSLQFPSPPSIE